MNRVDRYPTQRALLTNPARRTHSTTAALARTALQVTLAFILAMLAFSNAHARKVVAWGVNDEGQTSASPTLDAIAVAGGASHSVALRADGTVTAWGSNAFGATSVPPNLAGIVALAAGASHNLALKDDGTIVAWGYNFYGATTVPAGLSNVRAVAGGAYHSIALKNDGTVVVWGYDGYGLRNVPAGLTNVVAIAAGAYHNVALKADGTVVGWGYNLFGVQAIPSGLNNVVAIAAGNYHTLALKADGTVVAWGYNRNGGTSVPSGLGDVVAISGGAYHSLALRRNGSVVTWGYNSTGTGAVPAALTEVNSIAAGYYHNLVLSVPIEPPVAVAGPDQRTTEGSIVVLDGSASRDPNVPPFPLSAPNWRQTAGPSVLLMNSTSFVASFLAPSVPPSGAVLTFALTVSNGAATTTSNVSVTIDNINAVPTADAGANRTVDENALVTLQGSGSDADGDALTLTWTQVGGPAVTLTDTDTVEPTFSAPAVSTEQSSVDLTFRLVVNDGLVNSAPSDIVIRVVNTNDPPVANAGANQVVNEGDLVTLAGSATDPNDDPLTCEWTQIGGLPLVILAAADSSAATFSAPEVALGGATLTFQMTASDGELTSTSIVNVRVTNVNHRPAADAGADQTVPAGEFVRLDGSSSADSDGDILSYAWVQTGGATVELSDASTAAPGFTTPIVGTNGVTLTFELTVDDGFGGMNTDEVRVNVRYVNRRPTASAGADQTAREETLVTLRANAADPDDNALTYLWSQVSGEPVDLSDPHSLETSFTAPAVTRTGGHAVFRFTASDAYGGSASDEVSIEIGNVNRAPTAQAPANMNVETGATVELIGSGADQDVEEQSELTFRWQQTAGPAVTLNGSGDRVSFVAPALAETAASMTLTFRLTASDPSGAAGTDAVDVTISDTPKNPIAHAGGNITANEGATVTLNGSASNNPNGGTLSYSWVQTDGEKVTLEDAKTAFPHFTAPFVSAPGATLKFVLTVKNSSGATAKDAATVTVVNVDDPPNIAEARPSVAVLWPPDHRMVPVSILGVVDRNKTCKITITSVTQDEPVNDRRRGHRNRGKDDDDGDRYEKNHLSGDNDDADDDHADRETVPDAIINKDGTVLLRAERVFGDGRVYCIKFTAANAEGSASGAVKVTVPLIKRWPARESRTRYNSVTGERVD